MENKREVDIHDVESDMNALEDVNGSPKEFYRLIKTMASAITFEDGTPYTE